MVEIVPDKLRVATKNSTVYVLYYPSEVTKLSRVFIEQNEISNFVLVSFESLVGWKSIKICKFKKGYLCKLREKICNEG